MTIQQIPQFVLYQTGYPAVDATYDLGKTANRFRDGYLSRYAILSNASAYVENVTVDGADTARLSILPTGHAQVITPFDPDFASNRGAFITMSGNEAVTNSGDLRLESGGAAASSILMYINNAGTGCIMFGKHTASLATDTVFWVVGNSGAFTPGTDNTYNFGADNARPATTYLKVTHMNGDVIMDKAGDNDYYTNTADAADSSSIRFAGGGAFTVSGSRGSSFASYGNEHGSNPGKFLLYGGAVATGDILFETTHASATIKLRANSADNLSLVPGKTTYTPSSGAYDIVASTNTNVLTICGGTTTAAGNGPTIQFRGASASSAGQLTIDGANLSTGDIVIELNNSSPSIKFKGSGGAALLTIPNTGILQFNVAANESTGAGTALLGTNSPATTNTAPYTWIKMKTSDGSTVYMPVWK